MFSSESFSSFCSDVILDFQTKMKPNLAQMFANMHSSVVLCSKQMLVEMRRKNYVTPTNYLELVDGYKKSVAHALILY